MSGSTKRPAESIDVEGGFKEIGCMGRTFRVKWNGGKVQPPGPNCNRFILPESFKNHVRNHCGECWGMGTEGKPSKIRRAALATHSQSENDTGRSAGQPEFAEKSVDQPNLRSESIDTPEDDVKSDANNESQTKDVEDVEGEMRISGTVTIKHSQSYSFEFEVVIVDPQLREKIKEAVAEAIIQFYGDQTLSKTEGLRAESVDGTASSSS
ncbi:MAG: hypothetical protein J3Q66DRAFT_320396 [Benniella sp.]|nr:MAG: hypothetical protein J3Q66DRAFT_320396 [Benniella sp.]